MRLELGSPVRCTDDLFGELADVVINPITKRVTHLVVQPRHQHGLSRLVPVALAERSDTAPPEISLRCTVEEVRRLAPMQEFAYLRLNEFPVKDPDWDIGIENVFAMPYYGDSGLSGYAAELDPHVAISYDRIPTGEVEIRRTSRVTSSDGHDGGHVDGFLADPDEQITHVVLEHGHLWGRREVTIPIATIREVETDAVTLSLSKDEVGALDEPLPVQRWSS
jgi:hypothetical protein